jgi:uncharacterized heparinase superfamily protein
MPLPSPAVDHIPRYLRALRQRTPPQVLWQLWHRVHRPRPDLRPAPAIRPTSGVWMAFAVKHPRLIDADRIRLLNRERPLTAAAVWNDPAGGAFWLQHLHAFDDLNAPEAEERRDWHRRLIQRWVSENPPGLGVGWAPLPTALRIANWIKWALSGSALNSNWRDCLAVQARWLAAGVARRARTQDLLAEAKGLICAGLFFDGEEAGRWLTAGFDLLARELPAQILPDGGHCERSPMVHALALEDVLDLVNLTRAYTDAVPAAQRDLVAGLPGLAARMLRHLAAMCHPDGEIAFFNDAAWGIAPPQALLRRYARRLGLAAGDDHRDGLHYQRDSGYIRINLGPAAVILDVAPLGAGCTTGHAHADTLSFELSLFGRRVLVNSGTSTYEFGPARLHQRGTPAHNTVTIDALDSSQVGQVALEARRANPYGLQSRLADGFLSIGCAHDGYLSLPGKPVHVREWHLKPDCLVVRDVIEGHCSTAMARFHFHPDLTLVAETDGFRVDLPDGHRLKIAIDEGAAALRPATWHPEFGTSLPNTCLEVLLTQRRTTTTFEWQ